MREAAHYDFDKMNFNYDAAWMACNHGGPVDLASAFNWSSTPQGHDFWADRGETKEAKDIIACMLDLYTALRNGTS